MLHDIPDEILYLIYSIVIHPSNNFFYIIKNISSKISKSSIIELIKNERMICYYCRLIFDIEIIIRNGGYCSMDKMPICKEHYFICEICSVIHDFYQHSFICDCCMNCK